MKTNGLVGCAALALSICLSSLLLADEFVQDELPYETPVVTYYTPHWFAGTELTFMGVNAQSGGVVTMSFSDTTAPGVATTAFVDGKGVSDFAYAPRFWIGRQLSSNWGVRGSIFALNDSESGAPRQNPAIPTTGTNFGTFSNWGTAKLASVDIDLVRSWVPADSWKLDTFAGARYSHFDVASGVEAFGVFTTGNFVNLQLENGCQFDGVGPSLGFSSRSQLGNTNFYLLWSGRGSVMFGTADMYSLSAGTVSSSPSAPLVGAGPDAENNVASTLGIVESQLGVQYEFAVYDTPFSCFFRLAGEFQYWNLNNTPPNAIQSGFGGTIGELTTNSGTTAGPGRATLVGLSVATGFTW